MLEKPKILRISGASILLTAFVCAALFMCFSFSGVTMAQVCNNPNPSQCPPSQNTDLNENPIVKDINQGVTFLAALVGVVVVGSLIFGGIQYIMAGDNPQAVSAARQRMMNSLIALVAFGFLYAFLQWLVPGGIF